MSGVTTVMDIPETDRRKAVREALGIIGEGILDQQASLGLDVSELLTLQGMLADTINAAYAQEHGNDPMDHLNWLRVDADVCDEASA